MRRGHVLRPVLWIAAAGLCAAGTALGATQHDSELESLCLGSDDSRDEIVTVETRLASVPALLRVPRTITRPP